MDNTKFLKIRDILALSISDDMCIRFKSKVNSYIGNGSTIQWIPKWAAFAIYDSSSKGNKPRMGSFEIGTLKNYDLVVEVEILDKKLEV